MDEVLTFQGHPRWVVYVLYEWDFGLLSYVNNLDRAADDLVFTVEYLVKQRNSAGQALKRLAGPTNMKWVS